jgi:hypothetical protein
MPWFVWLAVAWAAPWPVVWLLGRLHLPWWPRDGLESLGTGVETMATTAASQPSKEPA